MARLNRAHWRQQIRQQQVGTADDQQKSPHLPTIKSRHFLGGIFWLGGSDSDGDNNNDLYYTSISSATTTTTTTSTSNILTSNSLSTSVASETGASVTTTSSLIGTSTSPIQQTSTSSKDLSSTVAATSVTGASPPLSTSSIISSLTSSPIASSSSTSSSSSAPRMTASLSEGAQVGIVVAVTAVTVLLIGAATLLFLRRRLRRRNCHGAPPPRTSFTPSLVSRLRRFRPERTSGFSMNGFGVLPEDSSSETCSKTDGATHGSFASQQRHHSSFSSRGGRTFSWRDLTAPASVALAARTSRRGSLFRNSQFSVNSGFFGSMPGPRRHDSHDSTDMFATQLSPPPPPPPPPAFLKPGMQRRSSNGVPPGDKRDLLALSSQSFGTVGVLMEELLEEASSQNNGQGQIQRRGTLEGSKVEEYVPRSDSRLHLSAFPEKKSPSASSFSDTSSEAEEDLEDEEHLVSKR